MSKNIYMKTSEHLQTIPIPWTSQVPIPVSTNMLGSSAKVILDMLDWVLYKSLPVTLLVEYKASLRTRGLLN